MKEGSGKVENRKTEYGRNQHLATEITHTQLIRNLKRSIGLTER